MKKARANGEGRIYRPWYKDKATSERKQTETYWIQYHDPRRPKGKQKVRESSKSPKKRAAVKLLQARLEAIGKGRPAGPDVERTTLGDLRRMFLDQAIKDRLKSSKRIKGALAHLLPEEEKRTEARGRKRNFVAFFSPQERAITVTEDRLSAYVAHRMGEGAGNGTINRELAALRRMFRLGMRAKKVGALPNFDLLAEATARAGFCAPEVFNAIEAKLPEPVKPVGRAAYVTGWRVASEILTRQWKHVDFGPERWLCACVGPDGRSIVRTGARCDTCGKYRSGWLRLEPGETKNGDGRMFPLTPDLRAVLERQREKTTALEQEDGRIIPWVFHRKGKPIVSFLKAWKRACRDAGVPGLIPHDLRRTAVRNLERAGVPRSAAMKLVGHVTESMYRRYAIVDEAMLAEGAEKLTRLHDAQRTVAAPKVVGINDGSR